MGKVSVMFKLDQTVLDALEAEARSDRSTIADILRDAIRRDLRRRSAIEPAIGHMKTDGRLARCVLKGTLGDALHAVLCGCGHNIRMILAHLRALWAEIVAAIYAMFGTKRAPIAAQTGLRSLTA